MTLFSDKENNTFNSIISTSREIQNKNNRDMESFIDKDILTDDLLKMLEFGSTNDIQIKLSDGEINANKDILMARSDYFATMFRTDKFIEGKSKSVDMRHCSKAVMDKIIKYLFSGNNV